MSQSLIQIVDENDKPVGSASMNEAQEKGLFHRVVSVVVEDLSGKQILLQKRSKFAKTYPGCWDVSAAGHVDAGEDYEKAAQRELKEELGLSEFKLQELGKLKNKDVFDGRKLFRFNKVYKIVIPKNTPLQLQTAELSTTSWIEIGQLKKLLKETPDKFAKGVFLFIENFYS